MSSFRNRYLNKNNNRNHHHQTTSIPENELHHDEKSSSLPNRRNSWSSDVGVSIDDQELSPYRQQNGGGVELLNVVTPDGENSSAQHQFFYDDDDEHDDDDDMPDDEKLFEPYHDPETNRIIMRMRMGSLMDHDEDDEFEEADENATVKTSAVEDQSPTWALFERSALDRLTMFQKKKKKKKNHPEYEEEDEDELDDGTPFDQVSYTDPYNAWDSLPSFLQTPYSLISSSKRKKQNNNNGNRQQQQQQIVSNNSKRKMKEMRINKQGFLEESTITTTTSSSSTASFSVDQHHGGAAAVAAAAAAGGYREKRHHPITEVPQFPSGSISESPSIGLSESLSIQEEDDIIISGDPSLLIPPTVTSDHDEASKLAAGSDHTSEPSDCSPPQQQQRQGSWKVVPTSDTLQQQERRPPMDQLEGATESPSVRREPQQQHSSSATPNNGTNNNESQPAARSTEMRPSSVENDEQTTTTTTPSFRIRKSQHSSILKLRAKFESTEKRSHPTVMADPVSTESSPPVSSAAPSKTDEASLSASPTRRSSSSRTSTTKPSVQLLVVDEQTSAASLKEGETTTTTTIESSTLPKSSLPTSQLSPFLQEESKPIPTENGQRSLPDDRQPNGNSTNKRSVQSPQDEQASAVMKKGETTTTTTIESSSSPKSLQTSHLSPFQEESKKPIPTDNNGQQSLPPNVQQKEPTAAAVGRDTIRLSKEHQNVRHRSGHDESTIETMLEMYKSMIQNKSLTTISEIRKSMKEDAILSDREISAFLFGLELTLSQHQNHHQQQQQERKSSLLSKSSSSSPEQTQHQTTRKKVVVVKSSLSSSPSEAGTTTSSGTTSSSRMKARASIRSSGFDQGMSNLMATIKKENALPSSRRRKKTTTIRGDDDAKTSISVMSTLSCRDLSIQRLRRRLAATTTNNTIADNKNKKEQEELARVLQELQDAQNRQKRLEQQLNQAGITIAEDIPYAEAKMQVSKIASEMQAIGHSQATHVDPKVQAKLRQDYFVLEQKMEKYMRALELTDEYLQEQERMENAFDDDNMEENQKALRQVWKHMPVNIRQRSVEEWLETKTPTGQYIPKPFLLKFSRTNILTLLRMDPDFIQRAHPSNLEQRRVTGLTLTERRALQAFLYPIATKKWRNAKDALTKRKWNWYCILRQTLKDHLLSYQHHVSQHECTFENNNGIYCCGCGGLKCPVKADQKLNYYLNDYGYPSNITNPEYETTSDPASCAPAPKKDNSEEAAATTSSSKSKQQARPSFLSELTSSKRPQKKEMLPRKSSLMEEIAAQAAKRKNKSTNKSS